MAERERRIVGKASRSNKELHRTDHRPHAMSTNHRNEIRYCRRSGMPGRTPKMRIFMILPKTRKNGHGFARAVSLEGADGDGLVHIGMSSDL